MCWDKVDECGQYIVALVQYTPEHENIISVCEDGIYKGSYGHGYDLFLVTPEEELTGWEKEVRHFSDACARRPNYVPSDGDIRNWAAELLAIAREQFIKDGYVIEKKAFHDAVEKVSPEVMKEVSDKVDMEEALRLEYERGKADALKDLQENLANNDIYRVPEWLREVLVMAKNNGKKELLKDLPRWYDNVYASDGTLYIDWRKGEGFLCYEGKIISLKDLEKLSGFKEDEK